MNKKHILYSILVGLVASASWAAEVDLSKLPPPSDKKGLTYEKDVKPMLDASCIRCHGADRPKAGLRLDTLEGVLKGTKEGKVLVANDSKKSQIVISAARLDPESAMPPTKGPGGGRPGGPGAAGPGAQRPQGNPEGAGGPGGDQRGPGGPGGGGQRGPGGPGGPGGFGPPPKPLTVEQVGVLRAWIDQGAK
jgi:hypothetical protein